MTQPEARISQRILKLLRAQGFFAYKVHGDEYTMSGLPDIIVCARGRFVGLETKTPDKRANVSAIQRLRHDQVREAGGAVFVVCSAQEALRRVLEVLEGEAP